MKKASPFSQRIKKPKKMRSSRGKAPLRMTPVALDGILTALNAEGERARGGEKGKDKLAQDDQLKNSFDGIFRIDKKEGRKNPVPQYMKTRDTGSLS